MRIYIHAGMHKTGTTSLQKVLLNSSEKLKDLGYRAFVNCSQMDAKNVCFDSSWLKHQVELAKKDGLQAVVFSAEMISTFNAEQLSRFMEAFIGYEVSFVVCFRHWTSFLPSRWAQNCSRRDTQSFPAYVKNLKIHEKTHIDACFDVVVQRLIDINVRKIKIISYDNATAFERLLPICLSAFDLPQFFVNNIQGINLRENVHKNIETTELVRLFNGVYSRYNGLESNELFLGLSQEIPVKQFYDFSNKMKTVLQGHDKLKRELVGIIKESRVIVTLSKNDSCIAKWQRSVEEISNGLVLNLYNAMLFPDVQDVKFACSKVELEDLPVKVQKKMAAAFEIEMD